MRNSHVLDESPQGSGTESFADFWHCDQHPVDATGAFVALHHIDDGNGPLHVVRRAESAKVSRRTFDREYETDATPRSNPSTETRPRHRWPSGASSAGGGRLSVGTTRVEHRFAPETPFDEEVEGGRARRHIAIRDRQEFVF